MWRRLTLDDRRRCVLRRCKVCVVAKVDKVLPRRFWSTMMRLPLVALAIGAAAAANDTCFTQSWDACKCDDLTCRETGLGWDCLATCHERLMSDACTALSGNCPQYDAVACGGVDAWCWNGEGSCPQCRDQACDVRPGAFCHGDPSTCKTAFTSGAAATCGAVWGFQCAGVGVAVEDTLAVVGDGETITAASLKAALAAWDAYASNATGAACDCSKSGSCQKNDLCLFVQGSLNRTKGLPYAPQKDASGFDRNCCAACHERGPPPPHV